MELVPTQPSVSNVCGLLPRIVNCFAEEGGGDVSGGDHAAGAGEGDIDPLLAGEADDSAADTAELTRHNIDLVIRTEMRRLRPKETDMKIVRGSGQDETPDLALGDHQRGIVTRGAEGEVVVVEREARLGLPGNTVARLGLGEVGQDEVEHGAQTAAGLAERLAVIRLLALDARRDHGPGHGEVGVVAVVHQEIGGAPLTGVGGPHDEPLLHGVRDKADRHPRARAFHGGERYGVEAIVCR